MGYITEDGNHEGWDATEFPDGRISVGSGNGGVLVRTPEEIISGSGIQPPDVIDGRAAIGWRGICTCGWLGPLWRHVPDPEQHDLARRQVHHEPDKWGIAPAEVEDAIYAEWNAHLPHPTLADIAAAADEARKAAARLDEAVRRARAANQTWKAIGDAARHDRAGRRRALAQAIATRSPWRKSMNLNRPIVVVDRRTHRIARRKIAALMDRGDYTRAKFGVTATMLWLRYEVRTGPKRHRIRYAADLEQLEVIEAEVNELLGLTP